GHGPYRGIGTGKTLLKLAGRLGERGRGFTFDHDRADQARRFGTVGLERFVQVLIVKPKHLQVGRVWSVVNSANRKFQVAAVNRPLKQDLVANIPVTVAGDLSTNHTTGAVELPGRQLLWRQLVFGKDVEDGVGIGGKLSKGQFVVLVESTE